MTAYTFDENLYSDLHKDVYGFRPLSRDEFYTSSADQQQKIWDDLLESLEQVVNQERIEKEAAATSFQELINKTIDLGASSEDAAIRWILDGENFTVFDYQYGAEFVSYHFGLPYNNKWVENIQQIIKEKVEKIDSWRQK
jgi:hypothetical protein